MAPVPLATEDESIPLSLTILAFRARDSIQISSLLKRHFIHFLGERSETSSSLLHLLQTRQSSALIPDNYTNRNSGPSPGTVVGIVLGSVAGFLFVLWLLYTCFGGGSIWPSNESEGSVVIRERKRSHRSHSTRSRRVSEVREVRIPPPVERIIVTEERRERRTSRPAPVESSISSEADEVVVIEEHSPPRRAKSKRESRESGYRPVEPGVFGGGDRPLRKVSGSRR